MYSALSFQVWSVAHFSQWSMIGIFGLHDMVPQADNGREDIAKEIPSKWKAMLVSTQYKTTKNFIAKALG